MKVVIPSTACRHKKKFFGPPMMSFAFLDMIFVGKGFEINTYKPLKIYLVMSHTHVVNTVSLAKVIQRAKIDVLKQFYITVKIL